MGNACSSGNAEGTDFQTFIADYIPLRKEKDTLYGEVTLLEHKSTHEIVALKELLSKSSSDFKHDIKSFNDRLALQHPNVLRLISFNSRSEDKLCSSFYRIQVIIEYNNINLEKEIAERTKNQERYTEEQLWYLIECILQGLEALQERETFHGDIKPGNIFVSRLGNYKIAEQELIAGVPTYAQRVTGVADVHGYLSPELLRALERRELKPKHDIQKSDVFSLGMTILQAATLANCDDLYDWDKNVLKTSELNERVASVGKNYSPELQKVVESMLSPEEGARPTVSDLLKTLPRRKNDDVQVEEGMRVEGERAGKTTGGDKKVESGAPVEEQQIEKPVLNGEVTVKQDEPVQEVEQQTKEQVQEPKPEEKVQAVINLEIQPKPTTSYTPNVNLTIGGTYHRPTPTTQPHHREEPAKQGEVTAKPTYQYGSGRTQYQPTTSKPTEVKPTESKPTEVKPTEAKPTEVKPTEVKPTGPITYQSTTSYTRQQPPTTTGTGLYQPSTITATVNVSNPLKSYQPASLTKPTEQQQQPTEAKPTGTSTYQPLSRTGTTPADQRDKSPTGTYTKPITSSTQPTTTTYQPATSKYTSAYNPGTATTQLRTVQGGSPTGEQPEKVQASVNIKPTANITVGLQLNPPVQTTTTDATNTKPQPSSYLSNYQPKSYQLSSPAGTRPTADQQGSSNLPAVDVKTTLTQPTTTISQPTATVSQPMTTVNQPTSNVTQPTATVSQPTTTKYQPLGNVTAAVKYQPSSTTQPIVEATLPTSYLSQPVSIGVQLNVTPSQPTTTAGQSGYLRSQPTTSVTQPVTTQDQPTTTKDQPTTTTPSGRYEGRYTPTNSSSKLYAGREGTSPVHQNRPASTQDQKPLDQLTTEILNIQNPADKPQVREEGTAQRFARRPAEAEKRSEYQGPSGLDKPNPYLSKPFEFQVTATTTSELPKTEDKTYQSYQPNISVNISSGPSTYKPTYGLKSQDKPEGSAPTDKPYSGNLPLQTKNDYSIDRPLRSQDVSHLSSTSKPLDSQLGVSLDPYRGENEKSFGNYKVTDPYTVGRQENQQFEPSPEKSLNRYDLAPSNQICKN